jgi:hypothetical protein
MVRIAHAAPFLLLLAACGTAESHEGPASTRQRPPLTHVPGDVPSRRAQALWETRFPATLFQLGPHALLRDSAAWHRFWRTSGRPAPEVDFRGANVLALRVYDRTTVDAAAPELRARGGMTFLMIPNDAGPPRPSGADAVVFYYIPIGGGLVRFVAYEPGL